MKLEFIPIREQDGAKIMPRRRGSLRLYWILRDSPKAAISGGYTLGASPI